MVCGNTGHTTVQILNGGCDGRQVQPNLCSAADGWRAGRRILRPGHADGHQVGAGTRLRAAANPETEAGIGQAESVGRRSVDEFSVVELGLGHRLVRGHGRTVEGERAPSRQRQDLDTCQRVALSRC